MIYTEHCILHGFGFERFHCYYRTFIFQTCLILKSSLLLLIHSRPFFASSPSFSYFIATVSLVHFLSLFSWVRRRQFSTWVTCYLLFITINFCRIQHAMRLVEKACFITDSPSSKYEHRRASALLRNN